MRIFNMRFVYVPKFNLKNTFSSLLNVTVEALLFVDTHVVPLSPYFTAY